MKDCACDEDGFCQYHAERPEEVRAEARASLLREIAEALDFNGLDPETKADRIALWEDLEIAVNESDMHTTRDDILAALRSLLKGDS
jgi:hypothetical protein